MTVKALKQGITQLTAEILVCARDCMTVKALKLGVDKAKKDCLCFGPGTE